MSGTTMGWIAANLDGAAAMRRDAGKLTKPILLLQAGKNEWSDAASQTEVCRAAKACEMAVLADSYHGILFETDSIRDAAFARTDSDGWKTLGPNDIIGVDIRAL